MIYDPKEREIQAISYRDRIVQHTLCDNFLMPLLEKRLIYDNVACRKRKGSGFAIARLKQFMVNHYRKCGGRGYFVKLDIKKYFNNIDHEVLKQKLYAIVSDENIRWLLDVIIDSYNFSLGRGLPMGNQSSQCFALLYLDKIDRLIKENLRIKHYLRYMDDMILLVADKQTARLCIETVRDRIGDFKLELNYKSQIIAVKNGIEFLGWRFFYSGSGKVVQKLRHSTKKRILSKLKQNYVSKSNKKYDRNAVLASYRGFLFEGDSRLLFFKIAKILSL